MKYPTLETIIKESPGTVIDPNWEDSISYKAFKELKAITGCNTYKSLLKQFEGYTIEEMLSLFKGKEIKAEV